MTEKTLNTIALIYYFAVILFAIFFGQATSEVYPVNVNFIMNVGFFSGLAIYAIIYDCFLLKKATY